MQEEDDYKFAHPDKGKRAMLGRVARKTFQSCGILLDKMADGIAGVVRVWLEPNPANRHGHGSHHCSHGGRYDGRRTHEEI